MFKKYTKILSVILIVLISSDVSSFSKNSVEGAIAWAEAQGVGDNVDEIHDRPWAWWCLHFVGHCYLNNHAGDESAIDAWNRDGDDKYGPQMTDPNPPRGALVFFDSTEYGHVGLSVGDGTMWHAFRDGVRHDAISSYSTYLGWRWPDGWTDDREIPLMVYDFFKKEGPLYTDLNSDALNPNFDAQYKVRNDNSQAITIDQLALAVHNSADQMVLDLLDPDTGAERYYDNLTLDPGESHHFAFSVGSIQSPGDYKLVAKAKISGNWRTLRSVHFVMQSPSDFSASDCNFLDVKKGEWYEKFVISLCEKDIITGGSDRNFRPGDHINRAEFVKILIEASPEKHLTLENQENDPNPTYTDIPPDTSTWYHSYVKQAYNLGWLHTDDPEFRPSDFITRAEAAEMIDKATPNLKESDKIKVDYYDVGMHVALGSIIGVSKKGILSGYWDEESKSREFRPDKPINRAEAAKIMNLAFFDEGMSLGGTSIEVSLIVTDITGLHGIGSTPAVDVPRVYLSEEPRGIACDGSEGVDDGARLLVRVLVPSSLGMKAVGLLSPPEWGCIDDSGEFINLPTSKRDGEYIGLTSGDLTALTALGSGLSVPGEVHENHSGYNVLSASIYKPPVEFDLDNPNNPLKERSLTLAARVQWANEELKKMPKKTIALVRPPLVLVHGVNSSPDMWGNFDSVDPKQFTVRFDTYPINNWGFHCVDFRAAHNMVDKERLEEGDTYGFGEISHMYKCVSEAISSAIDKFQKETPTVLKSIAVQKVDIVAHSYGGLLSRWYTEQSDEYENRKDVRKLITLCTPHRGSPLANMVCEVFKNPLIAEAFAEGVLAYEPEMNDLLESLDIEGYGTSTEGLEYLKGKLPNALDAERTAPRHAYQIFSVNSECLATLNSVPFCDEIGYAAVIGTDESLKSYMGVGFGKPFYALMPNWDSWNSYSKSYFPWIWEFNQGATDGIVPKWSARLGDERYNSYINVNHISVGNNSEVNNRVREWLNSPLSRGATQRQGFNSGRSPVSERNAYVGSMVGPDGISHGAGLNPNAIVKVELSDISPFEATYTTNPSDVGIKQVVLTGMIRKNRIGQATFEIVIDSDLYDTTLHNLGSLTESGLGIALDQLLDVGDNDYVAYRITSGKIGRKHNGTLTGPNGEGFYHDSGKYLVGYEMADLPGGQSPPTIARTPEFKLPAPVLLNSDGITYWVTVNGAVETAESGQQHVHFQLWDEDVGEDDDKLDETIGPDHFVFPRPDGVWDGLLIPYSTSIGLYLDDDDHVRGQTGSSGEKPAQVYQILIDGYHSTRSAVISVP